MAVERWGGMGEVATQPTNRVVWPHETDPAWGGLFSGPWVWGVESALRIPSVSRATQVYTGTIRQAALDAYRGVIPLPRPRILDRPDPNRSRSWFVGVQIEDYLWHGNALCMVAGRTAEGWPAAVVWVPAAWTTLVETPGEPVRYYVGGTEVPAADIIHVRRSANRWSPAKGVGVIEQHLSTLDRVALEEEYERNALSRAGVPSVAVVAPGTLSQDEADDADERWASKFAVRKPVFLPFGTTITPLGWSPSDAQMVEARKMSLVDVANAFNLDGYWVGAESKGLNYKSPGPMYLTLVRTSLEPVMADFEQAWADAWLPRGQSIRFDRLQLTRDDTASGVDAMTKAITPPNGAPELPALMTREEARLYLGLPPTPTGATITSPVDTEEG